jgi:alpha-L-fucosidase
MQINPLSIHPLKQADGTPLQPEVKNVSRFLAFCGAAASLAAQPPPNNVVLHTDGMGFKDPGANNAAPRLNTLQTHMPKSNPIAEENTFEIDPVADTPPSESGLKNDPALCEDFMDWGLGLFIHWSLDSELGCVISHTMVGASDDYLDRYVHELPKYFDPRDYDPEAWAKLAKLAGFKYMVLTTKHHSGFCLWPTETTEFSIANTPYKRDIVRQFVDACRKYDLKVGFYFSPEDFLFIHRQGLEITRNGEHANVSTNPALLAHAEAQIRELFSNYGPVDMAFLDAFDKAPIAQLIHQLQPACLVTRGEMKTPEQKIPDEPLPGPWEACFTLGTQWQFKPTNEVYKSGAQLIQMLIEIRAKGGNLLINMGPEPSGRIPFEQERTFRELALWMFVNGECIHNIRPCPVIREGGLWFTRSSKDKGTVYVIIPQGETLWKRGERREFTLRSLRMDGEAGISVLGQNSRVVEYQPEANPECRLAQTDEGLWISVVRAQRLYNNHKWPNPIVVKLEGVRFLADDNRKRKHATP